jgi:hypothetical protein
MPTPEPSIMKISNVNVKSAKTIPNVVKNSPASIVESE